MKNLTVRVLAPATVANVGSAFDVLGFALEQPCDEIIAGFSDKPGVEISAITSAYGKIPHCAKSNTASVAVQALLETLHEPRGISLQINKGMPSGSGLGSSAASASGAVFAANELLGRPYSRQELVRFAMQGEKVACGVAHADNVAPALCGGFALIRDPDLPDIISIKYPQKLCVAVVCPLIELRTSDARQVLKQKILLKEAVLQFGNIGGLVAGLFMEDLELIGRSLVDRIVEPIRAALIPGYADAKAAALACGALGCSISGSGPALFAFAASLQHATQIAAAIKASFAKRDISALSIISKINASGVKVVS